MAHEERPEGQTEEGAGGQTIENIEQSVRDLSARVEAARMERERSLQSKLVEREKLIELSRQQKEVYEKALEAKDYFEEVKQLGDLTDPKDIEKLEELQGIVDTATRDLDTLDDKIATISEVPAVGERMRDIADAENAEFDRQASFTAQREKEQAETKEKAEQFLKDFEAYMQERERIFAEYPTKGTRKNEAKDALERFYRNLRWRLDEDKSEFRKSSVWNEIMPNHDRRAESPDLVRKLLTAERAKLGLFKGKEKGVVDHILGDMSHVEEWYAASNEYDDLVSRRRDHESRGRSFVQEARNILPFLPQEDRVNFRQRFEALCGENGKDIAREIRGSSY